MATPKVLIVDDDPNIIYLCKKLLRAAGLDVCGVGRGQEAIQLCRQTAFDLLLLDFKMPDLDGLEVLRQVRQIQPDVAAIFITGYGTMETAVEAMRLGAQEFMLKPFEGDVLMAKVQQVLAHRQESAAVVRGNLRTMSLTSIVSINCNEGNQAHLTIWHDGQRADIFFDSGSIVHIALDDHEGEEVIYEILTWEEGTFELRQDVPPPKRTVTTPWSALLLEGLRRIDEQSAPASGEVALDEWEIGPEAEFTPGLEPESEGKEVKQMATKKRSQVLAERLETLLAESSGIRAAVIVGYDGLVLASNIPVGGHDATRMGAEGTALVGLSRRMLETLKCGTPQAIILEGTDGFIITTAAGRKAVVIGLTDADVNLGMSLLEMRDIAKDVAETLG